MPYVIDTHALIWFLTEDAKLGVNARRVMEQIAAGREEGLIPTIVLAEVLYASERGRIPLTLGQVVAELKPQKKFKIVSFTKKIMLRVERLKRVTELHDRLIVATALEAKAILVTRDSNIVNSGEVETIW